MKLRLSFSWLLAALSLALSSAVHAQSGMIRGTVRDESGEVLAFVTVRLMQNGICVAGANADEEGQYVIRPVQAGVYELRFGYLGETQSMNGVVVEPGMCMKQDFTFVQEAMPCLCGGEEWPVIDYFLVIPENKVVDAEMLEETGIRDPLDAVSMANPAVYQADQGDPIYLAGGRSHANQVYIDGVKTVGELGLPRASIEEVEVIIYGSTPAEYGDFTGGVVTITTRTYKAPRPMAREYSRTLYKL